MYGAVEVDAITMRCPDGVLQTVLPGRFGGGCDLDFSYPVYAVPVRESNRFLWHDVMKLFPAHVIKEIDAYTVRHESVASIDLMERAACELTKAVAERWGKEVPVTVFAGPGNNGGDALAVARMLSGRGYEVEVFLFNPYGKLSADCQANKVLLEGLPDVRFHEIKDRFVPPALTEEHLLIDGLFGSGLNKPLGGGFASVVRYINASPATVVSIDLPSGLMGEENTYNIKEHIVRAHLTLSLQFPKLAFFFAENEEYVGRWDLLDIGLSKEAISETETDYELSELEDIRTLIRPRGRFSHKGDYGHALLIAGSWGMAGASVLSARACLRSGVGKLTVRAPRCNRDILQMTVPEAMVDTDAHESCHTVPVECTAHYQAVGIGPGLGTCPETVEAFARQLQEVRVPLVLDADALNALALQRHLLDDLPAGSVLTPHPKELERLVGKCQDSYERLTKARDLAREAQVFILLKGAFSTLVTPEGRCYFNITGNPGMATAGSGDVLTGMVLALLAQGYPSEEAARIAMYVHGLAGDFARRKKGEIALTAGDLVDYLPYAWQAVSE